MFLVRNDLFEPCLDEDLDEFRDKLVSDVQQGNDSDVTVQLLSVLLTEQARRVIEGEGD